jgi:dTMP kinase
MTSPHEYPGLFIALEGAHGCGKTTQAARLAEWLLGEGCDVHATREVGGTELGEKLREIIADPLYAPALEATPESLLFLVLAARSVHIKQIVLPALYEGKVVICERFNGSTYAHQSYAACLAWDDICRMHRFASCDITPDITILLDIPASLGMARKKRQGSPGFWDIRSDDYNERVVQGYHEASQWLPNWVVIDATQEVEVVSEEVRRTVAPLLDRIT